MATRWVRGEISHDFSGAMKTLPPGDHPAVIASRSSERAKEFAKRHGIPKAYGSYVELANNPAIDELRALHIPRSVEKELGGGALLAIGVYCLQFVLMVFNGERPESIKATGVLLDSGVDESVVVVMKLSRNRTAFCAFSIAARLPNDAVISGTEGAIKVLGPEHCPTTKGERRGDKVSSAPPTALLRNEAEEVRQCLLKGLKESPRMPLADSVLLTEIMDEIRKQVGVAFHQDSQ